MDKAIPGANETDTSKDSSKNICKRSVTELLQIHPSCTQIILSLKQRAPDIIRKFEFLFSWFYKWPRDFIDKKHA